MANNNAATAKGYGKQTQWIDPFELKDQYGNSCIKVANGSEFTSGTVIGIQNKPAAQSSGTQGVVGAQFSPRAASGIDVASIVGVQGQPLLKGSTTDLTGDFGGFEADLTDSNVAGNTIGGDVYALRAYQNLVATVTGEVCAIKVDTAGSTLQWTSFAKLPDDGHMSKSTQTTSTAAGWIAIRIGSALRYIQTYSGTPS